MANPVAFFRRHRRLLILPPIALGVIVVALMVQGRPGPERTPTTERVVKVRTLAAPEIAVRPRAVGYGTVGPRDRWRAIPQIAGKIIKIHPRLKQGVIISADEELLRIDPARYEIAVRKFTADVESATAQIREIDVRKTNFSQSLTIERRALKLGRRDLARKQALRKKGALSAAAAEQQERSVLTQAQRVQEIENALALIPAQRGALVAKRSLTEAQLADAELDLERTVITAPYDLRLSRVAADVTQYVRPGEILAEGDGISVAEITAQIPVDQIIQLAPGTMRIGNLPTADLSFLPARLGASAIVRLSTGDIDTSWRARLVRMDFIDPKTRTAGVVVAVDDPIRKAQPGKRPPLITGLYVEVALRGTPRPPRIALPEEALRIDGDGKPLVYVVNSDSRLTRRPVTIALRQRAFITLSTGITAGELVILSDPIPAIEGMKVTAVADPAAMSRLRFVTGTAGGTSANPGNGR